MQTLLQQNHRLHQIMQKCEEQIMQLKKIGQDHQQQIDNLLKFNQRLLSIIENQMPNKVLSRTSSGSNLHPIDQMGEKESEVLVVPHRFTTKSHPIKDKIEHVDKDEIDRMSGDQMGGQDEDQQEDNFKKHVNLPINSIYRNNNNNQGNSRQNDNYGGNNYQGNNYNNNYGNSYGNNYSGNNYSGNNYNPNPQDDYDTSNNPNTMNNPNNPQQQLLDPKNSSDGFSRFRSVQSYDTTQNQRPQLSTGRNSSQHQHIIYREEKESLIEIPKLFKLEKGLNEHYHKELFQSIEEGKKQGAGGNAGFGGSNRFGGGGNGGGGNGHKEALYTPQMNQISEAVTQRILLTEDQLAQEFLTIRHLIQEYKQDFDTDEYTHLCTIIKNDLQNDLKELLTINNESMKFYTTKEKEIGRLRAEIGRFSPVDKLVEIIRRLGIDAETERLIVGKVGVNSNSGGNNNGGNSGGNNTGNNAGNYGNNSGSNNVGSMNQIPGTRPVPPSSGNNYNSNNYNNHTNNNYTPTPPKDTGRGNARR